MMSSAETMRSGLPGEFGGSFSHGCSKPGMRRFDTENPGQSGLGFCAAAGRTLVADLATGTRGSAGKRRNRSRVVVRLHLHEDVDGLVDGAVDVVLGIREVALAQRPFHDRGIVAVRREHALRILRVRVADHREQRLRLALAVDDPVGVEDLVAAVLGVRLREHHELDVGGIALQRREVLHQVVDLVVGQRQAELGVRRHQRVTPARQRNGAQRPRLLVREQSRRVAAVEQHGFGHAVEQRRGAARAASSRGKPRGVDASRRCRARCAARPRGRTRGRCRWPCSTRARSCRNAVPR